MRRSLMIGLAMLMAGVALPADAKNYGVSAKDNFFTRAFVVVRVGDSVTWRNDGTVEHTVTSFPGSPRSFSSSESARCVPAPLVDNDPDDCMDPGDTFTVRFTQPGTYDYFCKVHGSTNQRPDGARDATDQPCDMCGRVVVKAESTAPPSTGSPRTRQPSVDPSESPSGSPSPSASPSVSPSPTSTTDEDLAAGGDDAGGRGLGRGAIALLGIAALSGAGWWTWRRYLASV